MLDHAGVQASAVQTRFDRMDGPVMDTTPDFAKALDSGTSICRDRRQCCRDPGAFWTPEVAKMQKAYGAPIDDAAVPKIVEYLASTYGR